jgi:diguanylate cyclase (GGDEF)-like protein
MPASATARSLLLAAAALLALHAAVDLAGPDSGAFEEAFGLWYQPVVFLGCGLATLVRARSLAERAPWILLGTGLVLYASGSVYFNLVLADDPSPPFPSLADGLWLALYPLAFAALTALVRARFTNVGASVWLDGVLGGAVVAAFVAAVVFQPVFDVTLEHGGASIARLGYPLGDLVPLGFVVAVWCLNGRLEPFLALLGAGFALLAVGDSVYVVEAARGTWAPGGPLDLVYALGTMLLAAAAWTAPRQATVCDRPAPARVAVPSAFALAAFALTSYGVIASLNPLAIVLTLVTLLAVVMRFGLSLAWLTRQRADLADLAATDPLTGLANHRALHERLAEELDRARRHDLPLAVIVLDLDHFKTINDTYGHSEGDVVLQRIARALRARSRGYDIVARVGGEEFALVLPGSDAAEALAMAERCREALAEIRVHGHGVTCSAGVAAHPEDSPDGGRLLEMADGALYQAKQSGRDQVRRYDDREVVLLSGAEQQAQVRAVLDQPDAMTPVFQPIVELTTGRIAGYEALSRFPNATPVRPPDLWFAQARRCGLGNALEARAIANALAVPGRPAGTFLTLNASPAALVSPEVARVLPDDLTDIVIELTEDELFASDAGLDAQLAVLRERGARIAVDDAGAGYAGLQQLIRIKPDILKLDRSLVEGVHADTSKTALLESLSRFAISTGAAVCAEGIEDVDELRALAHFDVAYAQGYALARPAPGWPSIAVDVAGAATSEERWGMRLARPSGGATGLVSFGEVADALARIRSRADLRGAVALVRRLAQADEVAVSSVVPGERCVETLHDLSFTNTGERFSYDDYPTTERVIVHQTLGQIVAGDPAANRAEVALLQDNGYGAVIMVPIVFRAETVGLLELYRRAARPWTAGEIDQARMLAHHLGAAIAAPAGALV